MNKNKLALCHKNTAIVNPHIMEIVVTLYNYNKMCDVPIVEIWDDVKLSSANLSRKQVLPTPESPIKISLIK